MPPEDSMFLEALSAARSGDRARARDLFTRLLKTDPNKAEYWVWMSAVVDTPKERAYCLNEALKRDPNNAAARRGLVILGLARPNEDDVIPLKEMRRNWQAPEPGPREAGPPSPISWKQVVAIVAGLFAVIAIIVVAVAGSREIRQRAIVLPTDFPVADTATPIPTATLFRLSPTPTFIGPTPLWMLLQATYTPTPLYVDTPHPAVEAYRIGIRALQRQDWSQMEDFMMQMLTIEPNAVDGLYYAGEALRLAGDDRSARERYQQAIDANPNFAPAYLGRARTTLARQGDAGLAAAQTDLETALQIDPHLGEAHLELANLLIRSGDVAGGAAQLDLAERDLPDSSLVHLARGRVALDAGRAAQAVAEAQAAHELDFTLLAAYRLLGEALLADQQSGDALSPLQTYLLYVEDDPAAYTMLARAYLAEGKVDLALDAFSKGIAISPADGALYLERARVRMEQEDYDEALADYREANNRLRTSFEASLGVAVALYWTEEPGLAYEQVRRTYSLTETDEQWAEVYYWEARSEEALLNFALAEETWRQLLALPEGSVSDGMTEFARQRLDEITGSTPTPTNTTTAAPATSRSSATTAVPTGTRTATVQPTRRTPSPTPQPTRRTPSATP